MILRYLFSVLCFVCVLQISVAQQYQSYSSDYSYVPSYTDEEIERRLTSLALCIKPHYNSTFKSYVKTYMMSKRAKARHIVGRTTMYFPIFEKYLAEENMPQDLKYVSVLESALNPHALSRSKAGGLWQFMPATGKEYGLAINSVVDERSDPHRSTKAALKYLKRLHKKYGDWALAIAAYNGGPGRVNTAIKRGRSKNFWRIQKYLPRETRNYVSAFFGAAYLINYYTAHNIEPDYPSLDMQLTDVVKVYNQTSFQKISEITGIPTHVIASLNPSYKRAYVPTSYQGNYLILPQRVIGTFIQYQQYPDTRTASAVPVTNTSNENNFFKTSYVVNAGENISMIAGIFNCTKYHLMAWNKITQPFVSQGQELTVFQPVVSASIPGKPYMASIDGSNATASVNTISQPTLRKHSTESIAILDIKKVVRGKSIAEGARTLESLSREPFTYHRIRRGESLSDIADLYPGVTIDDIMKINEFSRKKNLPKPGSRIKIKWRL